MVSSKHRLRLDPVSLRLLGWVVILFAAAWGSASIARADYEWTATVLGLSIGALATWQIRTTLNATRRQFERLLDAIASDDLSLRFHHGGDRMIENPELLQWRLRLQQSVQSFQAHRTRDTQQMNLYRSIVEEVPVALFDVVDAEKIQLLNRAARNMFRGASLIRVQSAPPPLRAAIEGINDHEQRMVYLPNLPTPSRFVLEIIRSFHAEAHHKIFAAKDVTQEIQSTESATWSKVAQILAHEINNSLTPVTSLAQSMRQDFAELCEQQPSSSESVQELHQDLRDGLDTLGRRSASLMRFVDDYRKISQIPRPQPVWFELRDLLANVKTLLLPQLAADGVQLEIRLESPALRLRADRGQVEQCLINLVKNASAACNESKQGRVIIKAGLDELGHMQLSVLDSGQGLPSKDIESIFVPFFSTRASGTGIGLSVVRQIMHAHGGRVQAMNRGDGPGACFRLTFVA